ncbi:MAG TPA: 30S ribosomal protein S17 [Kiritimatiellia bacterium]|nr:30S ribosomal protein S17 [Kiritimatiellia bacterium]HMP35437.1 30S ribosomal protein S17 [Kiritimatiellia bacterium]
MTEAVQRGVRKSRTGVVTSDKMDKTIVVAVTDRFRHPVYGKTVTRVKKFHAHDERNEAHLGDKVRIVETRPLSRLKNWRLVEIVHKSVRGAE